MVGAVVVRAGQRVAGGYHARAGAPHAEVVALDRAGSAARGATLYVTLEPCAHHGRTPPCVEAVLAAGLARVVVGMRDPDERTAGRSLVLLRRAGLEVTAGVEGQACRELNRGFLSRVERGRPFTHLKLGMSLDGRIATSTGESRWITGPRARAFVHRLRHDVDAIAVGSGTVLADDPELTARRGERVVHRPTRVVIDSKLRTPPDARLIDPEHPDRAWILGLRAASASRKRRLQRAGARVITVPARAGRIDMAKAWRTLGSLGANEILVEGGAGLAAQLLRTGLVDRSYLILAPLLIGGDGRAALEAIGVQRLSQALAPKRLETRRLGEDLLLVGEW
jgi:diaminohydroxyphosphoribosylaminopyrimidine deaminase/5-amino-6-(5-phosphoribosylamino)uracil reductase